MSVKAGVSDTLIAIREKLRGKIGETKVVRYWPGKAPDWARDIEEDEDEIHDRAPGDGGLDDAFPKHDDPGLVEKDDRRLRRLAENRAEDRAEVRADHRRIRQAEIISTLEEEERRRAEGADDTEEEAEIDERRRAIREKRLQHEKEQVWEEVEEEDEKDSEDDEFSEYETDSEEETEGGARMIKPVFVAKAERETIAERERAEAEERAAEEAERRRKEERKAETKKIVVEEIRREEEGRRPETTTGVGAAGAEEVETDDEAEEAEEYEAWKGREIGRVRREREEREVGMREKEEMERVRGMGEEERREWERKNPKQGVGGVVQKNKWRFMQKYYHKGAFFQSNPDDPSATAKTYDIYSRDFSAATGEDKMDRTILPKVMQVKHFGRSGRTKWTHLVNEDTTDWNSPWIYNDPLRAKYNSKMAGMNAPIGKPKGSKKIKEWDVK